MPHSLIGLDVGTDNVKIACRDKGLRFITRRMPENVINDEGIVSSQVMVEFLKSLRAEEGIHEKDCALVLTEQRSFFRHVSLPPMSVSELMINLPFEFRDYITEDPEGYSYDYIVDEMVYDEKGEPSRMELYAAAARKDMMDEYADILKRAGFRLRAVNPSPVAYMGLLREHNEAHPEDAGRDTVLVDIGYKKMLISLFKGQRFVGSRMIEAGCRDIEMAIADLKDVDLHVAGSYRVSNFEDVLDSEQCQAVYSRLIFEISKVVNFYSFSNPDTDIKGIYLSGGGASIDQLVMAMATEIDFPIWLINTLLPEEVRTSENAAVCSLAYAGLVAGEASINGN